MNDYLTCAIFCCQNQPFPAEKCERCDIWLIVASPASMQFPKDDGFDKGKLSVMAFLNNPLVT